MEKNPDAYDYSKAQVSWKRKPQHSRKAAWILAKIFSTYGFLKDSLYGSYLTPPPKSSRYQGH